MSESQDFYSSWLGCSAYGVGSINRIKDPVPIIFSPTDLSDCQIWLDANDPTTVISDGSNNVVYWSNKGTAGGQCLAGDGSVVTNKDTINGLNVLYFPPYADLRFVFQQTANPTTVFVVCNPLTDLTKAPLPYINWFDALSTVYNVGFSMYYDTGLSQFGYGIGANNLAVYIMSYNSNNPTNIPLLCAFRNDTNIVNNECILNNTNQTLTVSDVANYNLSEFNYYLGNPVHGTEFDYAEMIFYGRALSDEEVAQVSAYLTAKWAIKTLP